MILPHRSILFALVVGGLIASIPSNAQVMSGLDLWLRADDTTADNAGRVSTWTDQSGMGHNGSQSNTALQPLRVNNLLNGHATLKFDGGNDFFALTGQLLTSQQFTIMTVVSDTRGSGDNSFREIVSNWDPANSITSAFFGTTDNDGINNPIRARLTDQLGGATDPNNPQSGAGNIVDPASPFIFSGIASTTDAQVYQGANLIASKGGPLSTLDLTTPYVIGKQGSGNFEFWAGDMAEILVYNRTLTPAEFGQNVSYLQTKYFGVSQVPEPGLIALLTGTIFFGSNLLLRRKRK